MESEGSSGGKRPAREVPVAATAVLDHRAYYGRACGAGFALVSPDGALTVVDDRLGVVRQVDLGGPTGDLAVSADGAGWAWVVDGRLRLGDPDDPVSVPLPGEAACRWLPSGQALWVAHGTGDHVHVEVRTPDGRVRTSVTVPDEFGGSSVMLLPHPAPDAVVLWVAAGQDGQRSWLLRDPAAPAADPLPADDCLPALVGPDGTWLPAADDDRLVRRSWPGGACLGTLEWAEVDPDADRDGTDLPGADLVLLPGGAGSWSTGNGRLRTVDLTTMSVVDEIALAGHPVLTTAQLYPALADDHSPCGDFAYSVRGRGTSVLTVHKDDVLVLSDLRDWTPRSPGALNGPVGVVLR
ncbi:hypothetical protein ABZ816_15310 [Actinosynnema sp. NPDC047251]|uniref:Uncharacterized protein n=1 Tax=Saccharothrix espanaensis (strain ATCC 51144 / DSM 44229 / JCM 9112 / NBRC 15066 / NRRL 15764) TaxID=1179773 RepID=K0JVZ4_SACES|nr:hypothetical protein [Saccharothrix espanaensis]CCH29612.1 hypothetical protein BN6_22920 [Saccharothrix espanaensis DSM 44229]